MLPAGMIVPSYERMAQIMRKRKKYIPVFLLAVPVLAALLLAGTHGPEEPPALVTQAPETTAGTTAPEIENETEAEKAVRAYAQTHGLSLDAWPGSMIELLERNPETADFVLGYPELHEKEQPVDLSEYENCDTVPLFMQWDTRWGYIQYGSDVAGITGCGPVCLSMAAYYLTRDPAMSPDNLIRFALEKGYCVTGSGSAWTLISQGGEELGLDVTEIPLDEGRILANLRVGNPIICVMGPGDFTSGGHFVVMVGTEDGKIRINDPNSAKNSQTLWDYRRIESQIKNLWVIRRGT